MKLTAISDTHQKHDHIEKLYGKLSGDVIVHCGDATHHGKYEEIRNFVNWFKDLDFKYKIFSPGNHDITFQDDSGRLRNYLESEGIILLIDQEVKIDGIKFYGNPWTPMYYDWAFMADRGSDLLKSKSDAIPEDTDVLICHGPPANTVDNNGKVDVGDQFLRERVEKIQPTLLLCGHIHEGYGTSQLNSTLVANVAFLDRRHKPTHAPMKFEIDTKTLTLISYGPYDQLPILCPDCNQREVLENSDLCSECAQRYGM